VTPKNSTPCDWIASVAEFGARRGVEIAARRIAAHDELALLPEEFEGFMNSDLGVRRQSGAARLAARTLLQRLGLPGYAIPKAPSGAPLWPSGIVGSLAHDATFALAAVGWAKAASSVGIDLEPNEPLPSRLDVYVATPRERKLYSAALLNSRHLFVAKEAVYKAAFPINGEALDFQDIEIDFLEGRAHTRHGVSAEIILSGAECDHLCALAIVV
jgi:4'-phosphopantetheinyl transferase EntD